MSLGKVAVLVLAVALGALGIGAALGDSREHDAGPRIDLADEVRKSEVDDEVLAVQEGGGDGDDTNGDDGTNGGDNTGDGDRTAGNDGTNGGNNTGSPAPGGGGTRGATGGGGTT